MHRWLALVLAALAAALPLLDGELHGWLLAGLAAATGAAAALAMPQKNSFGFTFVLPGRNVTVGVLDAVPVTGTIGSEQDAAPTLVRRFFSLS
jgi:hypothetical protein